jgi:hypothetical protein
MSTRLGSSVSPFRERDGLSRPTPLPTLVGGLLVLALTTFCALGATSASAATQRPYLSQVGGFTEPVGLSIDTGDDLHVTDPGNAGLITELSPFPANAKIGEQDGEGHFTLGGAYIESAALGRNEKLYVGDSGEEVVHVFKPNGEWEATWTGFAGAGHVHVTVDDSGTLSDGRVYVSEGSGPVKAFGPNGEDAPFSAAAPYVVENKLIGTPTGPGEAVEPFGSAWAMSVGSNGNLYVVEREGQKVDEFEPSGQFVRGFSGAKTNLSAVAVDPTTGDVLAAEATSVLEFSPTGVLEGMTTVADGSPFTEIGGLAVDSNGTLYVSDRGAGRVDVFGPAEPLPLETDGGSVTGITDSTATLRAQITPNGHHTSYAFLYGTADCVVEPGDCTQTPVALQALGDGESAIEVSLRLIGLVPGTTYHYRLLVENTDTHELLPTTDRTFSTQGVGTSVLPDGRVWEMVSQPDKHGIPLEGITHEGGLIEAAADGSGLAYIARGPTDSEPASNRSIEPQQLLATRSAPGVWSTQDLTTPHRAPAGLTPGNPSEYKLFSPDLTSGIVEPAGATPLSPNTSERTPYLRETGGQFTPLVNEGNVTPGTKFGGSERSFEVFEETVAFRTATPDLKSIVLASPTSLVENFQVVGGNNPNLYMWNSGKLAAVSILPNENSAPNARVGNRDGQMRNAISADGSRVFFTAEPSPQDLHLYMRDLSLGTTLQIDAPASGIEESSSEKYPSFQFASRSGSTVFFTDDLKLTADSTAQQNEPDLYQCTIRQIGTELSCELKDLTIDGNPGEPANVRGAVIGSDEGAQTVYFVARGALAPGAVRGSCPTATEGQCLNLYAYDARQGTVRLVAILSEADHPDWLAAGDGTDLGEVTARVSPNGRYLAFMSDRLLTGYDNRDAHSGVRDQEVYLYDDVTANLTCVSCSPTGALPRGVFDPGEFPGLLVDRPQLWGGQTLAGSIPGWTRVDITHALYQSRYLSNSGRLFFNAGDALVPQDTNGTEDVYEYEPPQAEGQPASNNCTNSSLTYSAASSGCVSLISSGTSPEESAFLDASESGDDVFFLTAAKLSRTDTDAAYDIYDASVGGHAAEPSTVIECSGDGCQHPATAPSDPTPGTALLDGPANLTQCPKGRVKQKGRCVKKKQKKNKKKRNRKNGKKKSGSKSKKHKRANTEHGGHK